MMPTFACAPRNTAPRNTASRNTATRNTATHTIEPGARVHARTGMVRR